MNPVIGHPAAALRSAWGWELAGPPDAVLALGTHGHCCGAAFVPQGRIDMPAAVRRPAPELLWCPPGQVEAQVDIGPADGDGMRPVAVRLVFVRGGAMFFLAQQVTLAAADPVIGAAQFARSRQAARLHGQHWVGALLEVGSLTMLVGTTAGSRVTLSGRLPLKHGGVALADIPLGRLAVTGLGGSVSVCRPAAACTPLLKLQPVEAALVEAAA